VTGAELVPPIGAQISALASLAPDEPAVTCDGRTLTRGELDRSTNRLARAYAARGVEVGDYVTMVLPNSIEWIQAAVACLEAGRGGPSRCRHGCLTPSWPACWNCGRQPCWSAAITPK